MTDARRPTDLDCNDVRDLAAGFVLDALSPDEADAVRAHIATCDDGHAEMLELAAAVPVLAVDVPVVEPPAGLKARIMAAAAADLAEGPGSAASSGADSAAAVGSPVIAPVPFPSKQERAERAARRRPSIGAWALGLAAVLAIVALGGWNLSLRGELDGARAYERDVAAVLEVAAHDGALAAVLTPLEGAGPSGLAAIGPDGQVRIAMRELPATSGEQVYEAWVIGGDGLPVALGGFRVGAAGTGFFEATGIPVEPGIVLALTLEPEPGRTEPSGAPVSLGTVTAAG